MPLVGAAAAPHSHLQLFTRPAEDDDYKRLVQKGRDAMFVLREQVEPFDIVLENHAANRATGPCGYR